MYTNGDCRLVLYVEEETYIAFSILVLSVMNCMYYSFQFQAEIAMRKDGKPGMSNEEVISHITSSYMQHF